MKPDMNDSCNPGMGHDLGNFKGLNPKLKYGLSRNSFLITKLVLCAL